MKPPIDTVTFDLWNTLVAHDRLYDGRIRRVRTADILESLRTVEGLDVTRDDVERAYSLSDGLLAERWSDHLDMGLSEQLSVFLECLGLEPSARLRETIDKPYADAVMKVRPAIVEGAKGAVEYARERGFGVGLISNTGRTPGRAMRKLLEEYGLLSLFDVTSFSGEEGIMKPRPEIFLRTLRKLGSGPERTVHVGDHGLLDVLGARRAGMRCVQVTQYAPPGYEQYIPDISIEHIGGLPGAIESLTR